MMPNTNDARTGDLLLKAECLPDPVKGAPSTHEVYIENSGDCIVYVDEIVVRAGPGGGVAGLTLERAGQSSATLRLKSLGTYARRRNGAWLWSARKTQSNVRSEAIRTTVLFDRLAERTPLNNNAVRLKCSCDIDVAIE